MTDKIKKQADASVMGFIKYLSEHPCENFARILYVGEDCYIEERINGKTLEELVKEAPLSKKVSKNYMLQLCNAVKYLHDRNIIHRDIKPSNIMVSDEGVLKLIDFDIARKIKNENINQDTQILGTVGYAAPEQYGFTQTDMRSDIYSMGIVYNYMLTGEIPQKKLASGYAAEIILKATNLAPWERYKTVKDLEKDIMREKATAATVIGKVISTIPGFRSRNIFKLAVALVFYLFAISTEITMMNYVFSQPLGDGLFAFSVVMVTNIYVFLFFAFLVNWCNIADRFCRKIKNKFLRRIIPATALFVAASCVIMIIVPLRPMAFFLANPVVLLLRVIVGTITDAIFSIFNIT